MRGRRCEKRSRRRWCVQRTAISLYIAAQWPAILLHLQLYYPTGVHIRHPLAVSPPPFSPASLHPPLSLRPSLSNRQCVIPRVSHRPLLQGTDSSWVLTYPPIDNYGIPADTVRWQREGVKMLRLALLAATLIAADSASLGEGGREGGRKRGHGTGTVTFIVV